MSGTACIGPAGSGLPGPDPAAAGSPEEVAEVIRRYGKTGVDTVVLSPTAAEPHLDGVIELAAAARERL